MSNKQTRHKHTSCSKYRPQFQNPHSIPPVDEFRLDRILTKHLTTELTSVAASLDRVTSNYQQDLKNEIKKALAIEQKIQNKNINAIKRAQRLSKQWHGQRKLLGKGLHQVGDTDRSGRGKKDPSSDIDKLLVQVTEVSSNVKDLVSRVSELSVKRGGNGLPDSRKYPNLSKLFGIGNGSDLGSESTSELVSGDPSGNPSGDPSAADFIRPSEEQAEQGSLEESTISPNSEPLIHPLPESPQSTRRSTENVLQQVFKVPENIRQSQLTSDSKDKLNDLNQSPLPDVIDPDAFELFMDTSIAKYRERVDKKFNFSDSSTSKLTSELKPKSARNPLKLLSAGSIGLNGGQFTVPPLYEESDPFKYSFLPRKSSATVVESPELSLHKKFRIKVRPSQSETHTEAKPEGQNDSLESHMGDSPYDSQHGQNEQHVEDPQDAIESQAKLNGNDGEAWRSTEVHTDTEVVSGSSSFEETDNSSDSLDEHMSGSNTYCSMVSECVGAKVKKKRKRKMLLVQKEPSPKPKHEPSHRVLKPKQSILKLSNRKIEKSHIDFNLHTNVPPTTSAYTASPRASFINEETVSGTFLKVDASPQVLMADVESNIGSFNSHQKDLNIEWQAISRLKNLIIQNESPEKSNT